MLLKGIAAVSAVAAVLICICGGVAFWWLPALFVGALLVLTLAAFGFLCLVCAFVDMDKPQEHDSDQNAEPWFFHGNLPPGLTRGGKAVIISPSLYTTFHRRTSPVKKY